MEVKCRPVTSSLFRVMLQLGDESERTCFVGQTIYMVLYICTCACGIPAFCFAFSLPRHMAHSKCTRTREIIRDLLFVFKPRTHLRMRHPLRKIHPDEENRIGITHALRDPDLPTIVH